MKKNKGSIGKTPDAVLLRTDQTVIHTPLGAGAVKTPKAAGVKRPNTFSKSRDLREDRGERQIKTSHNPQTLPHGSKGVQ